MAKGANMVAFQLVLVLMMTAMAIWGPRMASCSNFVTFSGACNNLARQYRACGCSNIASDTHGGWSFTYQGQTGAAYSTVNCQGDPHTQFGSSIKACTPFGWQSFFIHC